MGNVTKYVGSNPRTSLYEQMEFNGNVERVITLIDESTNPRIIILETWLIIDYAIKQLLFVGLNLQEYRSAFFKPLSDSFERNLSLLFNLVDEQKKLLPKPIDYTLYLPRGFFMFCYQNHPKEFKVVQKLEYKFYEWIMSQNVSVKPDSDLSKFRFVTSEWMEVAETIAIDTDWRKAADRLNKARNCAAHSFNSSDLFQVLGLNGNEENKMRLLKKECSRLLSFLLGMEKEQTENQLL